MFTKSSASAGLFVWKKQQLFEKEVLLRALEPVARAAQTKKLLLLCCGAVGG
jgi:hypothetical protein